MSLKQLWTRKEIEVPPETGHGLRRVLGPVGLTSIGVGAIIGAGIFVMTGRVAHEEAGPGIMLSFVIAGFACALAAMCYAEFAALAPAAGSAYTYAYCTLGELFAWLLGWDLILEYAMSCSTVAAAWSEYFNKLIEVLFGAGMMVPKEFAYPTFDKDGIWQAYLNLPAVGIMLIITAILIRGIRESAFTNTVLVITKLAVVLLVIAAGVAFIDRANWTNAPMPDTTGVSPEKVTEKWGLLGLFGVDRQLAGVDDSVRSSFAPFGLSGIVFGAAIVFFAYIGFDAVSTHAEEAVKPQRSVPFGILASLAICTVLYIAVSAVMTGMTSYDKIDKKAAVATAFTSRGMNLVGGLIAVGGLAGMTSVLLITFQSQSRIFFAMSRDGLLPKNVFATIHPRFQTPHLSILLVGGVVCVVAALFDIDRLAEMVNIGTLLAFTTVCGAVLILRVKRPDLHRPFRTPLVWVVAPVGLLFNLGLMLFLKPFTWGALVVWLAIGAVIYIAYGYRNSVIGRRLRGELPPAAQPPTA